jgi:hypothetical protein
VKELIFSVLNVHRVSEVRQMGIHAAEPLVLGHSPFEVEIAIAKLRRYKLPCSDHTHIMEELIQTRGEALWSDMHKLVNY